ncbi:MAG: M56 family metallopeptidase [Oscillospiraceae bacterium]
MAGRRLGRAGAGAAGTGGLGRAVRPYQLALAGGDSQNPAHRDVHPDGGIAPIPLPPAAAPRTWADWLYLLYLAGVLALLGRYLLSYIRLRAALRRGQPAGEARTAQIAAAAERYGLTACPAVEVPGLSSAFICGLVHPVLALPAEETDEKVLLHELLHLQYRDVLWGLVLCLARCVHWCNPLLWYCANQAGNDLEALCDQRVLERAGGGGAARIWPDSALHG